MVLFTVITDINTGGVAGKNMILIRLDLDIDTSITHVCRGIFTSNIFGVYKGTYSFTLCPYLVYSNANICRFVKVPLRPHESRKCRVE